MKEASKPQLKTRTSIQQELEKKITSVNTVLDMVRLDLADLEVLWNGDWRASKLGSANLNISQAMTRLSDIAKGKK
jgi:hypothetical protein